jgi:hypothetical protein
MDSFPNRFQGYKWGIRVIFWWSIFAVLFMSFALCYAYRKQQNENKSSDKKNLVDLDNEEMNQTMAELVNNLILLLDAL